MISAPFTAASPALECHGDPSSLTGSQHSGRLDTAVLETRQHRACHACHASSTWQPCIFAQLGGSVRNAPLLHHTTQTAALQHQECMVHLQAVVSHPMLKQRPRASAIGQLAPCPDTTNRTTQWHQFRKQTPQTSAAGKLYKSSSLVKID